MHGWPPGGGVGGGGGGGGGFGHGGQPGGLVSLAGSGHGLQALQIATSKELHIAFVRLFAAYLHRGS